MGEEGEEVCGICVLRDGLKLIWSYVYESHVFAVGTMRGL